MPNTLISNDNLPFFKTNALKTTNDFNSFCISNAAVAAHNNYKQGNYATALAMLEFIDPKHLNPIQLRNLNHLKEQCRLFIL